MDELEREKQRFAIEDGRRCPGCRRLHTTYSSGMVYKHGLVVGERGRRLWHRHCYEKSYGKDS